MRKLDDIIVLYKTKKYVFKNYNELISLFLGEDYMNLSNTEKFIKRYENIFAMSLEKNIPIVDTNIGIIGDKGIVISSKYDILNSIIINNEITYILSICKYDDCLILEKADIKKSSFNLHLIKDKEIKGNYLVVNSYIDKLILVNLKNK